MSETTQTQGAPPAQSPSADPAYNPDAIAPPNDPAASYFTEPGKTLGVIDQADIDPDSAPPQPPQSSEVPMSEPPVEPPAAPPDATPGPDAPSPDAAVDGEQDATQDDQLVPRLRTTGFNERTRRALDFLARNREDNPTLEQALAYVDEHYPELAPPQGRPQAVEAPGGGDAPQGDAAPVAEDLDQRIAALREKMAEPSGAFDLAEYHKLNMELVDLVRQAAEARIEARLMAERENQGQAERDEASAREALAIYPDAGDPSHPLSAAIRMEIERVNRVNPQFFEDSDWRLTIAAKCAARLGVLPAAQDGQPGPGSTQTQAQDRSQRPGAPRVPSGNGAGATGPGQAPRVQAPVPSRVHGSSAAPVRTAAQDGQSIVEAAQTAPLDDVWEFLRVNGSRPAPN